MVKYIYNVELEAFRREDKRGKPLYVNITEANRIVNLLNLGHSVADINGRIALSSPKGTVTTINSFIRNYKEGNIEMPENAPAPVRTFESMSDSNRIDALEKRIDSIEEYLKLCEDEKLSGKVKRWLRF